MAEFIIPTPDPAVVDATLVELEKLRQDSTQANEIARRENEQASQKLNARLELIRHAKEALIENRRNAPVGERAVDHSDIVSYAQELEKFLNS